MKKSLIVTLLLVFFSGAGTAFAQAPQWNIDKDHSNFYFSVEHIYSAIQGRFGKYSAEIRFDPADLEGSSFLFEIEVDSIITHIPKRDKHLLSPDFFNEAEYPLIRFKSSKITETATDSYDVAGKLTIKGREYDLVLPLTLEGIQNHPMKKDSLVAGFNGRVTIDRLAHGVGGGKFYELGVVGKDVDIFVSLEVLRKE